MAWWNSIARTMNRPWFRRIAFAIGLLLVLWLVSAELAYYFSYSYFLRMLSTEGGLNVWLARALGGLLAIGVCVGVSMNLSLNKRRRLQGNAILVGSFVVFNLLMYACTRSTDALEAKQRLVTTSGDAMQWFFINEEGNWELFPHPGYGPLGQQLEAMTPEHARRYAAWKRQQEQQKQTQAHTLDAKNRADEEGRFRDTYINPTVLAAAHATGHTMFLKVAAAPPSDTATVERLLLERLKGRGCKAVTNVFKPAFVPTEFERLWQGDTSVADRLQLWTNPSNRAVLVRIHISDPQATSFAGIVSVTGTLSVVTVENGMRSSPHEFQASGAGVDAAAARSNCIKRICEAFDPAVLTSS